MTGNIWLPASAAFLWGIYVSKKTDFGRLTGWEAYLKDLAIALAGTPFMFVAAIKLLMPLFPPSLIPSDLAEITAFGLAFSLLLGVIGKATGKRQEIERAVQKALEEAKEDGGEEGAEGETGGEVRTEERMRKVIREELEGAMGELELSLGGSRSYETGQEYQRRVAQELESAGFEVEDNVGRGKPDCVIKRDGREVGIVAVRRAGVTKSRTVRWKDFKGDLDYARKSHLPLIISWWNPARRRLWLHVVEPEEIENIDPNDEESKREFRLTVPKWFWHEELEPDEDAQRKSANRRAWKRICEL